MFRGVGEAGVFVVVGGRLSFGARAQELLLDRLPPVVHVPAGSPHAETVRSALDLIDQELSRGEPSASLVAEHLAAVMLVHVLRLHLARDPRTASGWLAGLSDPVAAAVLTALHRDSRRPWTVAKLARKAAVSRSTLAARFKAAVGRGLLEYLTHWRIELAARQPREGSATLTVVARSVGHGSESALSVAFKCVMGMTPSDYRRRPARQASPSAVPPSAGGKRGNRLPDLHPLGAAGRVEGGGVRGAAVQRERARVRDGRRSVGHGTVRRRGP